MKKTRIVYVNIISILFICMLCGVKVYAASNDVHITDDYKYVIDENNNTIKITKYLGTEQTEVVIPDQIDGKKVTAISGWAFSGNKVIQKVTIPYSVVELGEEVFSNCSSLENVIINGELQKVGLRVMQGTKWLSDQFENGKFAVLDDVLVDTNGLDDDVILPEGIRVLCRCVPFNHKNSGETIKSLTLSSTVELLPESTDGYDDMDNCWYVKRDFDCRYLESINVDENNSYFTTYDGVLYDKSLTSLKAVPHCATGKISIPATVKKVYWQAIFGERDDIDLIEVGNSTILNDLSNPDVIHRNINITDVNGNTLKCGSYYEIIRKYLDYDDEIKGVVVTGVKDSNENIELHIPNSLDGHTVKEIKENAFNSCERITNITLPSTIDTIGENAFQNCNNLRSIRVMNDELLDYFEQETVDMISHNITVYKADGSIYIQNQSYVSENGDYKYSKCNGSVIITRYLGSDKEITIPDTIDGMSVVAIGTSAFSGMSPGTANADDNCAYIRKVTLPNTIREIYPYAFDFLFQLKEVKINEGLKYIGDYAFSWTSLEQINLPSTLRYIGKGAFALTHVKEFTLPEGLEYLGDEAFNDNSYLEKIWIPASLECGVMFGSGNINLREINVADGNKVYKSVDGVLYTKDMKTILLYPQMHGKTFTIPVGVENISETAFITRTYYNGSGEYDYEYTNSLENLEIPYTVRDIQMNALTKCGSLKTISVDSNNSNYKSCDGVLYSKDESILYVYPQGKEGNNYIVLSKTNTVADSAFNMNKSLKSVVLPKGLKVIENSAFYHCRYLVNITIYDSVSKIGNAVFALTPDYDYSSIKTITINCNENSFAYKYAKENDYLIDSISEDNTNGNKENNEDENDSDNNNLDNNNDNTNVNENADEKPPTTEQLASENTSEQISLDEKIDVPAKVKITSIKNKKTRSVVVVWRKIKNVSGYEIQYALNKKLSKNKKSKLTDKNKLTLKKLKKSKTYYVKIRAYNVNSKGTKTFGKWSAVKKIKIKK